VRGDDFNTHFVRLKSIMRKNAILNSPRLLELRRKKQKSTKIKIIIFGIFFLVLILGYLTSKTSIFFFGLPNAGTLISSAGTFTSSAGTLASSSLILNITSLPCMALF
jgi:hypothetical protein